MPPCRLFHSTLHEGLLELSVEESHHAIGSKRAKFGDEVTLFDGAGREATGRIAKVDRHRIHIDVARITTRPFDLVHRITLAVAVGKIHRQGYLIEKCTELGVAAIWPIIAGRSVSKPGPAAVEKWSRRAIEAAKQSGRCWVPTIAMPQAFPAVLARCGEFDALALTDTGSNDASFAAFLSAVREGSEILVLVGPEGGWTDDERKRAAENGAVLTNLGPTVLRTETAAVAVCAAAALGSVARG